MSCQRKHDQISILKNVVINESKGERKNDRHMENLQANLQGHISNGVC
jgi:hypothetical protein